MTTAHRVNGANRGATLSDSPIASTELVRTGRTILTVDARTRSHPVTQLAQEFGWRLSGSNGPGRPHYIGPGGWQMAALLVFDGEPGGGQSAFSYVLASKDGTHWDHVGYDSLPGEEQMRLLGDYFSRHALAVEGN